VDNSVDENLVKSAYEKLKVGARILFLKSGKLNTIYINNL